MNKDILKKELDKLGVNPNEYSLNGNIESDKIVLYQNYSKWEVFYFDERGGRNCEKVFVMKKMLVHIFMNYLSLTNNISNTHLNRLNSD